MSFYGANTSKAVVVGGISAIACVSAALYLYKKRRSNKKIRRKSPAVANKSAKYPRKKVKQVERINVTSGSDVASDTDSVSEVKERKIFKNGTKKHETMQQKTEQIAPVSDLEGQTSDFVDEKIINGYDRIESWSEEVEQAEREAEVRASSDLLADEFLSKVNVSTLTSTQNGPLECDGEVSNVLKAGTTLLPDSVQRLTSSPKTHCVESPSIGSDGRSEVGTFNDKILFPCLNECSCKI